MDSDEDVNAGYMAPDSDDEPTRVDWVQEKASIDKQEREATRRLTKIFAKNGGSRATTKEMLQKLQRREAPPPSDDEDDEFMNEMDSELQARFTAASGPAPKACAEAAAAAVGVVQGEHYEDEYFDSSEDEESRKRTRKRFTNDELLYDPEMDEEDAAWVQRERASHRGPLEPSDKQKAAAYNKAKGLEAVATSDAILNCPACMSVLCIDCQQHESYLHQYRAMFVMNCTIDRRESLKAAPSRRAARAQDKAKRKAAKAAAARGESEPSMTGLAASGMEWEAAEAAEADTVHPVMCSTCSTVVAVFDNEEVYHFFNVLASEA